MIREKNMQHISSVQHNVPAWAIFGMFFIVIPIAGNLIREREDGSALRITLIPGTASYVAMGKIIFYTLSLQFMLMLCIGLWAMPAFGCLHYTQAFMHGCLLPISLVHRFCCYCLWLFLQALYLKPSTRHCPSAQCR